MLCVLPGGQAPMFEELAQGKQFVYFCTPPEVSQMVVVERKSSESD